MIKLNTERGFIDTTWNELQKDPAFKKELNPDEELLDDVLGRYIEKSEIRCGLSNCHTPHLKGYIVKTKSGHITNIGKDCGTTYFGIDFKTFSKRLERDIKESNNRNLLWSFSFQIDELEDQIHKLRTSNYGADWVHKNIQPLITRGKGCPDKIIRTVLEMKKNRNNVLTKSREATEQEIEDQEAILGLLDNGNDNDDNSNNDSYKKLPRPYYIDEPIGELLGFETLYDENNLRKLLIKDLSESLAVFKKLNIDEMSYNDLLHWAKWAGTTEQTLSKCQSITTNGQKLLDKSNLKLLVNILEDPRDIKTYKSYISTVHVANDKAPA